MKNTERFYYINRDYENDKNEKDIKKKKANMKHKFILIADLKSPIKLKTLSSKLLSKFVNRKK